MQLTMLKYFNYALNRACGVNVCMLIDNGESEWAQRNLGRTEFNQLWSYERIS